MTTDRERVSELRAEWEAVGKDERWGSAGELVELVDSPDEDASEAAVEAIRRIATSRPEEFEDHVGALVDVVETDGRVPEYRSDLLTAIGSIAETYPDDAGAASELLLECHAADDVEVRLSAAGALAHVAAGDDSVVDRLVARVEDESRDHRDASVMALQNVAETHPEEAHRAMPCLTALAFDESESAFVRQRALDGIGGYADAYPEEIEALVPDLLDTVLDDRQTPDVRAAAAAALTASAPAHAEELVDEVDALGDLLESDDDTLRWRTLELLEELAVTKPRPVLSVAPAIRARLDDEFDLARGAAVRTLAELVVVDADRIDVDQDALVQFLDSATEDDVAAAATLLGYVGDATVIAELQSLDERDGTDAYRAALAAIDRIQTRQTAERSAGETRFCPSCNALLSGDDLFCPECGHDLNVRRCPSCGDVAPADATSCPHCGDAL